jgi:ATP-independent RNA helicase DbpA
MQSFESLSISTRLKEVIRELGYTSLTPIQEQSLPHLLAGRDLIGQSKTGSGKTAAFTIPILERIERDHEDLQRAPKLETLILCPTRELSMQVVREIRKLGRKHIGLQVLPVTGGQPLGPQIMALENGVHIAVGTPGRVLDHLSKRTIDLRKLKTLVLDEADRMLDMGFQDEMEQIMAELPKQRHTILFSATFPPSIEQLSQNFQQDAIRVTIEEDQNPKPNIIQKAIEVKLTQNEVYEFTDRLKILLHELARINPVSCMIFVNFKTTASELSRELRQIGIAAGALHGDLEQAERDSIMAKFRNQSIRVLIATDVAARGIDVDDMDLVVNFELPQKSDV